MKIKIEAQKNCYRYERLRAEGKEQQAVDAMRAIFEPMIRRDNEELEVEDLFDLIAVAAYSHERAYQLFELAEIKMQQMPEEAQQDTEKLIAWMKANAMCFLRTGFESWGKEEK